MRNDTIGQYSEDAFTLALPDDNTLYDNVESLLDATDSSKIFLTSDWHIFKAHYKKERNFVNVNDIVKWCKANISSNDVFMYLGDISYRYANEKDQKESAEIMASIPGHKVLILGNHDQYLGQEYYAKCGFDFVMEEIRWKNYVFTHRPIRMDTQPDDYINIHGHIHNITKYNTSDGSKNVNVYPYFYDNKPTTLKYVADHFDELTKNNEYNWNYGYGESAEIIDPTDKLSVLRHKIFSETKRSDLPDSAFGIPDERKFPLDTEQHVKSAIRLFGHASEDKKKSLAKRINDAAKKYDLAIPKTTQVYRYLNESVSDIIPEGINTVIFDFGGTLIDTNTNHAIITGLQVPNYLAKQIAAFLEEEFFPKLDEPRYVKCNVDQAKELFISMAPENYAQHVDEIFNVIAGAVYPYPFTYSLLKIMRAKGYSIYYLSNWAYSTYTMQQDVFTPLTSKFDGGMFNFESNYSKPDVRIYNELINKYNLDPSKCAFIDDKAENVIAANDCGLNGILFDNEVLNDLMSDNFNIPSDANNTILINTGIQLESVHVNQLGPWICSTQRNPSDMRECYYGDTLDYAVYELCESNKLNDDEPIEVYAFIESNRNNDHIPIGKLNVYQNANYEWLIQYPIEYDADEDVLTPCISEWSMASCNPIIGVNKPFILKVGSGYNSTIDTKQYALSPDIISDKYLVVNEDAKLEVVSSDRFKGCTIEAYEFIGDKTYLKKLNEFYKSGKTVDNTVFYTALANKPMLCEDQIDFDPLFKKVDFSSVTESIITEMATMKDKYLESIGLGAFWTPVVESAYSDKVPFLSKYNKHGDISIREDYDGLYFYSTLTKKRSGSVGTTSMLTEAMIKSIL